MTNMEIISLYETVADITDRMLAAARSGDWEQLARLESSCSRQVALLRQNEILGAPREALTPTAREKKVSIIKKILADDREIRTITEPWMEQLSALMNRASTERKLSRTYGSGQ